MKEISSETLGLILFMTIFMSMLLVPFTASLAKKFGAIDIPKSRSSHAIPIPRMGGLAISLSLTIACIAYLPLDSFLLAFLSGLVVIVSTGVIDDVAQVSPRWKFIGQIVAATLFVYLSGMKIEHVGNIFNTGNIELGAASFIFTVFCIVGGVNTFNLADGLDGLAGGVSIIAAVFLGYFAFEAGGNALLVLAVSLVGAVVGFLRYNSYPARVFMGDSGSLMLGYVIAVIVVTLSHSAPELPIASLAMVVALPLMDTLLVMARRIRYGHSPFLPDRTHLHHRLLDLYLPHPAVVGVIYFLMFSFGALSIVLRKQPDWIIFSWLLVFGSLIFFAVATLQRYGFHFNLPGRRRIRSVRQLKFFQTVESILQRSAKVLGMLVLVALLIPALFGPVVVLTKDKVLTLFLLSALLAAYSWKTSSTNKGILHGTIYLAIFALLLFYETSAVQESSWVAQYSQIVASAVMLWVVVKLIFSEHNEVVFASGFELLMLFVSWFIPFVVLDELRLLPSLVHAIKQACLLSIPFMLAMKINIRTFGGHNRWIVGPLVFGLVAVGIRGALLFR